MAITHTIGKLNGASQSLTLEVFVYDDGQPPAAIDEDQVVAHLNAAGDIPSTILGVPDDGDPGIQQVSNTLWKVSVRYRIASLRSLHPPLSGERRSGFNFHVDRKFVKWAPEVGKFWAGAGDAPSQGGLIGVTSGPHVEAVGAWLEPPGVDLTDSYSIARSTITNSWLRTIATIVRNGFVNSLSLTGGAYAAGEVMVAYLVGQPISETLFNLDIGWSWKQNVTGETREGVTGIAFEGQDFVWELATPAVDRATFTLNMNLKTVYVNRVRPRGDLSAIGLEPP